MQRGMSYRKPVPIYIPSPPTSPALLATQLPHSFENDPVLLQVDMQNILQQTLMQEQDIISISNIAVNGTPPLGQVPVLDKKAPLLVKSPEGEQIIIEDSNYTPLTAPSCLPPSAERRVKHKLHQQYRPPTPPLPSYTRNRAPDILPVAETPSTSLFGGSSGSSSPEIRRRPSIVTPSFSTCYTQSPSFQTEKTCISFGPFERCMFWPKGNNVGLHQSSKFPARRSRSELTVVDHNTENDEVSWWRKISKWATFIGLKAKGFANMYMC
ncbi:hypothetical protein H2248_006407 [Termitomyces sp. 'cryptogamus']|nr:hypothetical protein H2248_006407 [Termitomyces sp. 'cryptogamus']